MPRFDYTAIEQASGQEQRGAVDAASVAAAVASLKARGLAPLTVGAEAHEGRQETQSTQPVTPVSPTRPVGPGWRQWSFGRPASARELTIVTRQLSTLVKAGMPLLRAIEVLVRQEKNPRFHVVLAHLADHIRAGGTLSEGMQHHPRVFDRLYVSMVRAGEAGGMLEDVLLRQAVLLEKAQRLRGRVKAALTYPLIIVLVATGIVAALMVFVVPKFEAIFTGTLKGQPMPALTQLVIDASNLLKHHALLVAGLMAGLILLGRLVASSQVGRRAVDRLQLMVPVLGELYLKAAVAHFSRTFGTLLASGVPMLEALRTTRNTSGNQCIGQAIGTVHDRVKAGDGVASPLRATGIFPDMVPSMIEVGEETGALAEMLGRIADGYDEEVDTGVVALTTLIEPLMIVVMAVMVGTIVIALFLPIVRIIQLLG